MDATYIYHKIKDRLPLFKIRLVFLQFRNIVLSRTMIIDSKSSKEIIGICGFRSVAMLDYLERSGVFIPEKARNKSRGNPRKYTFRDAMVLKTISVLLNNGASVSSLKKALTMLQKFPWKADRATLEDSSGPLRHLIVSGEKVYFSRSNDELVDLAAGGQLAFSFLIDLDRLHADVQREWCQDRIRLSA